MLLVLLAATLLAALPIKDSAPAAAPLGAPSIVASPSTAAKSPAMGAVDALSRAYEDRSVDEFSAILTTDYRFHTSDPGALGRFSTTGLSRAHEIEAVRGMFVGDPHASDVYDRGARSIQVTHEDMVEADDPEHSDSTECYRIVVVKAFGLTMHFDQDMTIVAAPSLHVFHVVRGDAAVLAGDQYADPGRWYIRRWLEDVTAASEALAGISGDCDQAKGGAHAMPPGPAPGTTETMVLAIHPLGNPACPALDLRCDLPGREPATLDVFDVMGRRVASHDIPVAVPGARTIAAGAGANLKPGAYWVRLSQGRRKASTVLVLVAR